MKSIYLLCCCFILAAGLKAQDTPDCTDWLYLKNGSVFSGTIQSYTPGAEIHFKTWNNLDLRFDDSNVKRIVQRCKETGTGNAAQPKVYDFKERGWYHHTRLTFLPGRTYGYYGGSMGIALQHSSGYQWNRWFGTGLGIGGEVFNLDGDVATYPIYAEIRGYLTAKRTAPYYAVSAGWAFADNSGDQQRTWGQTSHYKGGFMGDVQIGYRIGNHFTIHTGLRLQRKTRDWASLWNAENGTDRILHRRLELGFGLLF